jgi:hypothetical protein
LIGQQPVSSHVRPEGAEAPNQHFAPESWQPLYRELSARRTYEDKIRYILPAPQTTFNGDSTDADNARQSRDQKSSAHAIHIKRRWEKKRKKLVASTVISSSPLGVRKKTSNYYLHHNKARSIKHAVFNEKEQIVSSRGRRSVLVSGGALPLVVVNEKSNSNSSWDDEEINWQPVALVSGSKHNNNTNTNATVISKKLLQVEQLDNHTLDSHLNASTLESSGNNTSFSDLGLVARFKKSDELEWVEIELKNDSMAPAPTRATNPGVPKPRSTFQSPYDPSIISLSPEVPNLVKKFIGQSHVDLMKPETLVVKYNSDGPQITGIYTTSPTVDGTLFGVVNSIARPPNYYDRPNIFDRPHINHNHRPPLYEDVRPQNHNNYRPPFHNNFHHDNRPLQPPMPQAPNPHVYTNFVPSGPSIFNDLGQHISALPPIFDDQPQPPVEPPLEFEQTLSNKPHFATVQQVNKPAQPFRPSFASGVISSTVIGIADAPNYQNNRPPYMHGGNYQYQAPETDDTHAEDVSEDSLFESSEEPEVVVDEFSEETLDTAEPLAPPSTTVPQTVASEIPRPEFTTSQTPTVIYGGIPVPIKPVLTHDPNCPNLTIIVSPTITNNNIQHIITAPPSHVYRPPNYPPPNYGGTYDVRPPSPFPAQPPVSYGPTVTRPPLLAQQQVPPSDDAPVEDVDDAEFANQEATAAPTEAPPTGSSEAPPPSSETPPVGTEAPPAVVTTMRPSFLTDLTNVFLNTSSPFFWLALTSPVVIMLAMLVGMTHYVVPSWRSTSTSTSNHHDPIKHIPHSIVVAKHKYKTKTTTKKPPKKKKRPPRGEPAGVPGVLWGRSIDIPDVKGRRRRRRFLDFGVT